MLFTKPLPILFQDDSIVAVHKPSGLLVHRSKIDRHETQFALQLVRDQIQQHVFPVHRLDKPTSGVLLFALNANIARQLGEQFASHRVAKRYLAVVRGYAPEQGVIDHPLKEELDKIADRQAQQDKPAQEAITTFKRLATVEIPFAVDRYPCSRYSLVEAIPKTGRKHQIRRHLKHIAHPIVGDAKHGKGNHNRFFQTQYQCHRLLLACTELALVHPVTQDPLLIHAPLEESFARLVEIFGWGSSVE